MKLAHLQAVAHDLAHQAQSGLTPLPWDLHRLCRASNVLTVTFDLLVPPYYPAELSPSESLEKTGHLLRATLEEFLRRRGFMPADLTKAVLHVAFASDLSDVDLYDTHARLEASGRTFQKRFPRLDQQQLHAPATFSPGKNRRLGVPVKSKSNSTHPNAAAFPAGLSGPALRALANAGIRSLDDLAQWTQADVAALHGMGPKGIRILEHALKDTSTRRTVSASPAE